MPQVDPATPTLKRDVGLLGLTSLTVGAVIGSGIFALMATMGSVAGPAAIVGILLLGVVIVVLALPYAELGSAFPTTGGPYTIPRRALGDYGGFLMGWGYFLYAFVGTAAIIDVFVEYLGTYVNGLWNTTTGIITGEGIAIALVFLAIFTILNIAGVKWGNIFAIVSTFAKLIPLILFAIVGLFFLREGGFSNFTAFGFAPFGWTGVMFAMALGFFAFTGFEAAVIPGDEVRSPGRTIPLATILSVLIVTVIYAFVGFTAIGSLHWASVGLTPGDWANTGGVLLSNIADGWGLVAIGAIVVAGALLSTGGAGGDWVLLQGRMPYAMAEDNLFFRFLGRIDSRYQTPALALIFASVLTGVVLIVLPSFPEVVLIASITALVPYPAAALSLSVLRRTEPTAPRPFRLPGAFVIAPAGFVMATILVYWASWPWTLVGGILMLAGLPLYLLFRRPTVREMLKVVWIAVYLVGIVVISYLGNPFFIYQNFLSVQPIGLFGTPEDIVILVVFGLVMYVWAYYSALVPEGTRTLSNGQVVVTAPLPARSPAPAPESAR
ncbi:MAG: APC family permease [Thermoplasmata archaeon]|nr:APC family permease [Thermoplasmata archaeon]